MGRRTRPWGPGTSAIVRALIAASAPVSQVELASRIGVSQPRVSQVLSRLAKAQAVNSTAQGYTGKRGELIELYLAHHRPALAEPEVAWHSLQTMHDQVERACAHARMASIQTGVSADLAPDLLAAWRHPTLSVIYTAEALDLTAAGFVRAEGRVDATVLIRHTSDLSLLAAGEPWPRIVDSLPVIDPVQQIWDLHDLGGGDRAEAANRLREAVISRALTTLA